MVIYIMDCHYMYMLCHKEYPGQYITQNVPLQMSWHKQIQICQMSYLTCTLEQNPIKRQKHKQEFKLNNLTLTEILKLHEQ